MDHRESLRLKSYFTKQDQQLDKRFGTEVMFSNDTNYAINDQFNTSSDSNSDDLDVFQQNLPAALRLVIIGAEHDTVQLCKFATLSGWEVCVIATDSDPKEISNFPGAKAVINTRAELFDMDLIDDRTAVM